MNPSPSPTPSWPARSPADTEWALPAPAVGLRLAEDLELAAELGGGRVAVLGKTGTGKSSTSRRFVEEVVAVADRSVVIYDCMGQWRGIKRSRDGSPGLPFLIAGDEEGDDFDLDHPIELVEAINRGHHIVVDVSQRRGPALARKAATLFDELYAEAGTRPILVVIEEADELAPQNPSYTGQRDSLLAVERLARRGRSRGIGLLVITQRSAAISKGVISQLDVLIAFGSPAPQDRKAISSWIPADDAPWKREILARLGSLAVGQAIVWQPSTMSLSLHHMSLPHTVDDESPAARRIPTNTQPPTEEAETGTDTETGMDTETDALLAAAPSGSPCPLPDDRCPTLAPTDDDVLRSAGTTPMWPNNARPVVWAVPATDQTRAGLTDEDIDLIVQRLRAGLAHDITAAIHEALHPSATTDPEAQIASEADVTPSSGDRAASPAPSPDPEDPISPVQSHTGTEQKVLDLVDGQDDLTVTDIEAAFVDRPDADVIGAIVALARDGLVHIRDNRVQRATPGS